MAAAHARELEEQHAWYEEELRGCEQLRDQALERLATEVERRLDDSSRAQREALEQERRAENLALTLALALTLTLTLTRTASPWAAPSPMAGAGRD